MEANLIKSNGSSKMLTPMLSTPDIIRDIEVFTKRLNEAPDPAGITKTPDGKAETLVISYVESKLDEVYLRLWGYDKCDFSVVANELCCDVIIWVIDPPTGCRITRAGTAAIPIMVDAVPDSVRGKARNEWALDLSNKKQNAVKLNRPAVKAMALKNAAASLGIVFGRNINRKIEDTPEDYYTQELDANEGIEMVAKQMEACKTLDDLLKIWTQHPDLHQNQLFIKHFKSHKQKINLKK